MTKNTPHPLSRPRKLPLAYSLITAILVYFLVLAATIVFSHILSSSKVSTSLDKTLASTLLSFTCVALMGTYLWVDYHRGSSILRLFITASLITFSVFALADHGVDLASDTTTQALIITVAWFLVTIVALLLYSSNKVQKEQHQLSQLTANAQIRVLSQQLSPHFLFNALNNLRFMLDMDAQKASVMARDIAGIFSELNSFSDKNFINLKTEVEFLARYLRLIQLHLGNKFNINILDSSHAKKTYVLPMLLQLLCENSIKHNLQHLTSGKLCVHIADKKNKIVYRVTSSRLNFTSDDAQSLKFGMRNIEERLTLAYGNEARFRFKEHFKTVSTLIIFPKKTNGEHFLH